METHDITILVSLVTAVVAATEGLILTSRGKIKQALVCIAIMIMCIFAIVNASKPQSRPVPASLIKQ